MTQATVLKVGSLTLAGLAAAFSGLGANAQSAATAATTASAVTAATAAGVPTAAANPVPPVNAQDNNELTEVVVTGTSIRGVAPVGSNLITVDRTEIDKTGAQTIQQILRDIPAITGSAATPQGGNPGNAFYAPTIHGLGSSSSNATLVLVDGHRISPGSQQQTLTDPNIVPPIMIERVEVLAEGASSTYGSDAVAGVVNFITRKSFDGVLVTGQGGVGNDYHTDAAGALWGTHWDSGSLMVGYNYSYRSDLAYSARDYLDRNHTAVGGKNYDTSFCSPAAINASPGNCQNQPTGDILPAEQRNNAMIKFTDAVNSDLDVGVDIVVSSVTNNTRTARGTLTATVQGAGVEANPFYVPVAVGSTAPETVRWDSDALLGSGGANSFNNNNDYYVSGTFEYRLGHDFRVTGLSLIGAEDSYVGNTGQLCVSCAYLALNGTTNSSGNQTTSAIPGTNTIVSNLPLTTANALDVWNPPGTNRTSAAVLAQLTNNVTDSRWNYSIVQDRLGLDGSLFSLPGGPLKVAGGIEYVHYGVNIDKTYPNNAGPSSLESQTFLLNVGRGVESGYGEVLVPIIGADNALPFVRKLDTSLSVRYDDYVGLATTSNPHFAFDWESFQGVTFRANYSTSFVAPQLTSVGNTADGGLTSFSGYGGSNTTLALPIASFPAVTALAATLGGGNSGVTCTATTCTINSGVNGVSANGGPRNPQPGHGQSWSVGFDLDPVFVPHFHANFALFNVNLFNQISGISASNVINSKALNSDLQIFPNGTTPLAAAASIGIPANWPQTSATASTVYYAISSRQQNFLDLYVQGVDADARYDIPTDKFGIYRVGGSVTYFTKFNQNIAGGPNFSVLNTTGFNNTFPSIQLQGRGDVGWDLAPFSTDMFVNFVGSYKNWSSTAINPVVTVNGVPTGGGDKVSPTITLDLHGAYNFGGTGRLGASQIYLDVTNLLNSRPAFYNSTFGYDTYAGNIIGRLVSAGFRIKL